jgi:hypothetical protein
MFNAEVEARAHLLGVRACLGSLLNGILAEGFIVTTAQTCHQLVVELSLKDGFLHSQHNKRSFRKGLLLGRVIFSHSENQYISYFVLGFKILE